MPNLIGQTLGGYRITQQIGLGGMATVFKAYQPSMDRYVAFKVISTHLAQDPTFVQRFQQEAKVIAKLEHTYILPVYDHGEDDGYLYLVMRFIEGGTLTQRLKQGPLSFAEIQRFVTQIGSALEYAHQRGVVHRDFKPSNVLIDHQGDHYLSDFGIARMVEGTLQLTGSSVLGTPHYMAPEQGQSAKVDHRADIYAMGVVIYQMVTGQVPFDADTPFAIVLKHVSEPLPLPRALKPDLPEAVERVILKALAKNPQDRFQSMANLVTAFEQAVQGLSVDENLTIASAPPPDENAPTVMSVATPTAVPPRRKQFPWWMPVAGLALVVGAAAIIWLGWRWVPQPDGVVTPTSPQESFLLATRVAATLFAGQTSQARAFTPTFTPTPAPTDTLSPTATPPPTPTPTPTPIPAVPDAVVGGQGSEVRAGPGAEYDIIAQAQPNELLQVTGRNTGGDWLEVVKPDGGRGWISILRLRVNILLDQVPLVTLPPTATPSLPATSTPRPASLATPVATATSVPPTAAPALQGKLAFSLRQHTQSKTYVVEVGPTTPSQLYASIGDARQPALSHDGKWLLVNATGGGIDAIARMTGDGFQAAAVTCLQTTAESGRPIWSPDDRLIAFDGLGVDIVNPQIYIQRLDEMDCDLGDNRLLVNGGLASDAHGLFPLWGPDNRLYFRSCSTWDPQGAGACGIWSTRQDGSDLRQLTDHVEHLPTAVNDKQLLYMFNNNGDWDIYAVGLQGGESQQLTRQPSADAWGTFSPDGRTIAFLSNRDGGWAIWLMNSDGSNAWQWLPLDPSWGEVDFNRIGEERMSWSR